MVNAARAEKEWGGVRGLPEDLCLSFANTRFWRGTDAPTEELRAPADLLRWCDANSGLDPAAVQGVAARWAADPAAGTAVLTAAVALREALYRIFSGTAGGGAAGTADLATVNAALAGHAGRTRLLPGADGLGWEVAGDAADLGLLLAPVLWSAGDLLTGRRLKLVRCCANERCRWLFLDDSKGATRRWCAMSACGNRAKAHRHYEKLRARLGR
jgi:predicted RNA-binding Zn ribbon-like protein